MISVFLVSPFLDVDCRCLYFPVPFILLLTRGAKDSFLPSKDFLINYISLSRTACVGCDSEVS